MLTTIKDNWSDKNVNEADIVNSIYESCKDAIKKFSRDKQLRFLINEGQEVFQHLKGLRLKNRVIEKDILEGLKINNKTTINDIYNSINYEDLRAIALSDQQAGRTRAGTAFELHLKRAFEEAGLEFEYQVRFPDNTKADFVFPSLKAYLDPNFPRYKLYIIEAKTTLRDRASEALALKNHTRNVYLVTCENVSKKAAEKVVGMDLNLIQINENEKFNFSYLVDKIKRNQQDVNSKLVKAL